MMQITSFVACSLSTATSKTSSDRITFIYHKLSNDQSELLLSTRSVCARMWSGTSWNQIKVTSSSWNFKSVRWQAYSLHHNFGTGTPIGPWTYSKCDRCK